MGKSCREADAFTDMSRLTCLCSCVIQGVWSAHRASQRGLCGYLVPGMVHRGTEEHVLWIFFIHLSWRKGHRQTMGKVYAGRNGILGALTEDLTDTSQESARAIAQLKYTPGGAFGSCRYQLPALEANPAPYERLIEVFKAHNIGYFFYNGGGDSQDTAWKVSQIGARLHYPIMCVGIPKTVDNDLPLTDNCPGFGSAAKYVAVSMREASLDVASMAKTSTKVFVLEVMGRHAGWITAACGLAGDKEGDPPPILLFPEIPFDEEKFLAQVHQYVEKYDYCTIAVISLPRRMWSKRIA